MKEKVISLLHEQFMVPLDSTEQTDLRTYLADSIDVGECVALLNDRLGTTLTLLDFKEAQTLGDVLALVQKNHEA
jgi:acyl carrier protein